MQRRKMCAKIFQNLLRFYCWLICNRCENFGLDFERMQSINNVFQVWQTSNIHSKITTVFVCSVNRRRMFCGNPALSLDTMIRLLIFRFSLLLVTISKQTRKECSQLSTAQAPEQKSLSKELNF